MIAVPHYLSPTEYLDNAVALFTESSWETVVYGAGSQIQLNSIDLKFEIVELYRGLDS